MEKPHTFEFVVGNKPEQLKAINNRRLKSHLSKRGWDAYRLSTACADDSLTTTDPCTKSVRSRRQSRRRKPSYKITYEYSYCADSGTPSLLPSGGVVQLMTPPPCPPIEHELGGGRIDPFKSYPGRLFAGADRFIDHYIVHMAVDIPELDGPGTPGLLRTSWFPLVLSESACFDVIMLLSASNYVSLKRLQNSSTSQLLQLKANAIDNITHNLAAATVASGNQNYRDGIIGAVAKMASFEAMHGDLKTYQLHMGAVRRMVEQRGGLNHLGLNGLLRRILIWIDLNSSFLLQTERFFPAQHFLYEGDSAPNPAAFTAPWPVNKILKRVFIVGTYVLMLSSGWAATNIDSYMNINATSI